MFRRDSLALMGPIEILPAGGAADLEAAAELFQAYAASLPIDLAYQGFKDELAALPGKYAPPGGALLLARSGDGREIGCVAMRPLADDGICEMKRLYVLPEARGLGAGGSLIAAIVAIAREAGYSEMRLDTLPTMQAALAMYRRANFQPIPAYYPTPVAGTIFLGLRL